MNKPNPQSGRLPLGSESGTIEIQPTGQAAIPEARVFALLLPSNLALSSPKPFIRLDSEETSIGRASASRDQARANSMESWKVYTPTTENYLMIGGTDEEVELSGDESISRAHAVIRREGPEWVVYDEQSTNGTYIDDVPVVSCVLRDGDRVRLGQNTLFHFRVLREIVR